MKNIVIALIVVLAAFSACEPPKNTTGTSADSTATNNNTRDTSASMQRDTSATQRDSSMKK